ncbi:hypothetical protein [Geomesophilobacter sediminis]|uniref:Lipoprotein n=1 Tax=Geomesophilobacter sediminis TaxID=2798584 RepID=A0A8J7M2U0_9BACT|nr:hypothetical protein [Geomesophilobacter sediminis]MBJ6727263.1 hypothetical protein [Geomesophilobacter sediminis]
MKARKTRWIGMIAVGLLLAGCGVDWFPDDSGKTFNNNSTASTSPTPTFSWPAQTVTLANAPLQDFETPEVTINGTSATGWPLSLRSTPAGAGTAVLINGSSYVLNTLGDGTTLATVKPGDTLKVYIKPTLTQNASVYTKVVLGTYSTAGVYTTTIKLTTVP